MSDDRHVIDLLPGLAMGGLEPDEERHAREHLLGCPACRGELLALEEVVGRVAMVLPSADPPAGLEARIMERVHASAARTERHRSPLAFFRHPAVGAIAAALILLLGAGNVLQWNRVTSLARTPVANGFFTIVLTGADPSRTVSGTMVLDTNNWGGTLAMRGLPRLDPGHQYQLWLVKDGKRVSGGVFDADEYGYANLLLRVPQDFRGFTATGVSVEPAGGSPSPTGTRVASGKL